MAGASQDWMEKDFYKALGVSKDASADEIKRAPPQVGQAVSSGSQSR